MLDRLRARFNRPVHSKLDNERGFSLLELLVAMGVFTILTAIAIGITPAIVRIARGDSGAQELDAFLKRHRELAIARRRDIEIHFDEPNQVRSVERAVPDPDAEVPPADRPLETLTFEGRIEYWQPDDVPDTPRLFGNGSVVVIGGENEVMGIFSSEGAFIDAGSNPVNATISLGVEADPLTATAVTILGTTAMIERFRWNGASWTK